MIEQYGDSEEHKPSRCTHNSSTHAPMFLQPSLITTVRMPRVCVNGTTSQVAENVVVQTVSPAKAGSDHD
jgi:hypothetical protein